MKIETENLDWHESHDLIGSTIIPQPIAFISTVGEDGTYNAAPFSFVVPVGSKPPIICVSFSMRQGKKKHTLANIEYSHDFVVNVVDETIIKQAVQASFEYPSDIDEIKAVGLTAIGSEKVKSPRIAESRINLECRLVQKLELPEEQGCRNIVFGEVVLVHIKDELLENGRIVPSRLGVVGRLGRDIYCRTGDVMEVKRS